eukprot:1648207-Amphidinium_carterae.1
MTAETVSGSCTLVFSPSSPASRIRATGTLIPVIVGSDKLTRCQESTLNAVEAKVLGGMSAGSCCRCRNETNLGLCCSPMCYIPDNVAQERLRGLNCFNRTEPKSAQHPLKSPPPTCR